MEGMMQMQQIVASDLEGTLTAGATWKGIGRYLQQNGRAAAYNAFFLPRLPGALLAMAHIISKERYRDKWMRDMLALLRGWSTDQISAMAEWVVEHELWPQRRTHVLAELEAHQTAGARVVITSGAYAPIIEVFARRVGAEAIGTAIEMKDGAVTGRMSPANTGALKAQQLQTYLAGARLHAAYGDTAADIPMLEMAAVPTAVHPDGPLQQIAVQKGWRILRAPSA